ncbi:hypothetical protein GF339_20280 [candidate division KSB3 bacterium]|uniref:MucB/RseB N-terminal domain-containing protein n=1 Tax=candidate division KSB3 bacterium TaxID=2044937 RepID=A0A9D5JYX6_9BACT|nr:hypothetical protein [candidate division KSB3 bacterium]MBD3326934.1 hypothetical protein [candidate division KSB3 bacterium]
MEQPCKRSKQWRRYWWLAILVLLVGQVSLAGAESALQFDDIITMLDHSGKEFNYLGTKFVIDYTASRQSTTLVKVTYGAPGWQKKEVAPLQPGQSQIILDDGKFLWHYIPSQASVVKKKRRLSLGEISDRIHLQNSLIQRNYHITIEESPPAKADPTPLPAVPGDVRVAFQPKTGDRPSWTIWIEREHGLVVRTEIYGINGKLALLSAFSDLTFEPKISKKSFVMTVPKNTKMWTAVEKNYSSIEEAQPHVGFPISPPAYLPEGFVLASVIHSHTKRGEKVQLAYIDGMSSISVFEEKRQAPSDASARAHADTDLDENIKGTFHDQGLLKILRWRLNDDLYVTLVGEVADSELLKIASSLIQ